jgi:hypothetical protein
VLFAIATQRALARRVIARRERPHPGAQPPMQQCPLLCPTPGWL